MAGFRKKKAVEVEQQTEQKANKKSGKKSNRVENRTELRHEGRIVARVIDAESGLKVINGIYAVRMNDEGERRLFMNDYTPTIGMVLGEVVMLTAKGEHKWENIRGFYKLQHNMFTLLIEEHLKKETKET